jgi:hypothetical protein
MKALPIKALVCSAMFTLGLSVSMSAAAQGTVSGNIDGNGLPGGNNVDNIAFQISGSHFLSLSIGDGSSRQTVTATTPGLSERIIEDLLYQLGVTGGAGGGLVALIVDDILLQLRQAGQAAADASRRAPAQGG